jgi:exonuclease III
MAMDSFICICTLNVRGLRNKMKRKPIFTRIKQDNIDIACLQKTYLTNDVVDEIRT